MISSSTYCPGNIIVSAFFIVKQNPVVYVWHIFFYSFTCYEISRLVPYFFYMGSAAKNMAMQISVWFDFESIGYTLRSDRVELYGISVLIH